MGMLHLGIFPIMGAGLRKQLFGNYEGERETVCPSSFGNPWVRVNGIIEWLM